MLDGIVFSSWTSKFLNIRQSQQPLENLSGISEVFPLAAVVHWQKTAGKLELESLEQASFFNMLDWRDILDSL